MPGIGNSAVSGGLNAVGVPKIDSNNPPPMKTLIYAPSARIIIAHGSKQYDVSGDLVNGGVLRPENATASLQFTLNNKQLRYNGLFEDMDRVILFLKRVKTIQVFSGYLDDVPYLQLYPGTVSFRATCTMKRLMHTWWDPSMSASQSLFQSAAGEAGQVVGDGTTAPGTKPIGSILRDLLVNVGGFDADKIHIENFPMKFLNIAKQWMLANSAQDQANVETFLQQMLGDDHSMGVGASASANPALTLGPPVAGAANYIATIIKVVDEMGMGPSTSDIQMSQDVAKAAQAGQASLTGSQDPGWAQLQGNAQNWTNQYRNTDAAILALACTMVETNPGPRILANPSVPESYNYPHDGEGSDGTSVGMYQQINGGQWGDVAQRMNAEASTRAFLLALQRYDWKNMDPGAAVQAVQQSGFPDRYAPMVAAATATIRAMRADQVAGKASPSSPVSALSPAGLIGTSQDAASLLPNLGPAAGGGSSPTSATALAGAGKPSPDAMGAIACGLSYVGSPYDQIRPPVRGRGVDCIAEGALIATARGPVPIEQVTTHDQVLTRRGYRPVLGAWKVRDDATVMKLSVADHSVQATPDHRVWTENRGWTPLAEVTSVDTLVLCRPNALSSRESRTIGIPIRTDRHIAPISKTHDMAPCTSPFGNIIMDVTYRPGMKSTTSTMTRSTTSRRIWDALKSRIIASRAKPTDDCTTTPARCAANHSGPTEPHSVLSDSAVVSTSRNSTTTPVKQRKSVYDLWIDGEHEFFADGILVHNCSGLTQMAYRSIGIDIGGNTTAQLAQNRGKEVSAANIQPGDICFPSSGHTFMWLGTGYPGGGGAGMILESSGSDWNHNGPSPDGPRVKPNHYNLNNMIAIFHIADFGGWDPTVKYNEPSLMGPGYAPGTFGSSASGTGASSVGAGGSGDEPLARNLFTYQFNYPAFAPKISALFTGERSLINCEPLINMVQTLCKATLRNWCSSPTGDFVAWYPDYWGLDGKRAVMYIEDIEMKDVSINRNDYSLITHAYVATGYASGQSMGPWGWITSGVATVENEALFQEMIRIAPGNEKGVTGADILAKFGARPFMKEYTMVQSSELRQLLAIHHFMEGWTNQFATNVQFTFMPELFPGMRIILNGHNLQVYVTQVQHSFDYGSGGFVTQATVTAPSVPNGSMQVNQGESLSPSSVLEQGQALLQRVAMS